MKIALKLRRDTLLLICLLIPFFLFTAFKSTDYGIDTVSYENEFNYYSETLKNDLRIEQGFGALSIFVSQYLNGDFRTLLIIFSSLIFLSLALIWYLYRGNVFVFVFGALSFGLFSFINSGLRQSIAMLIFWFSIYFLFKKQRLIIFILLSVVAYHFHISSLAASTFALSLYILVLLSTKDVSLGVRLSVFLLSCSLVFALSFILTQLNEKYIAVYDLDGARLNYKLCLFYVIISILSIASIRFKPSDKSYNLSSHNQPMEKKICRSYVFILLILIVVPLGYGIAVYIRLFDRFVLYFIPVYWSVVAYVFSSALASSKMRFIKFISVYCLLLMSGIMLFNFGS